MKNFPRLGGVVCLVVFASAWAAGEPVLGAAGAKEEQAVREAALAVGAALNARDYAGTAALFAEDGDLIGGNGPRASGREAIRATWEEWRKDIPDCRVDLTVRSVRFLGSEVAIVDATAELSACRAARDRSTYVIVRRGGQWQVAAMRLLPAERESGEPAATTPPELDPVKLSPDLYKVLLENEHVRVLEFRGKPGDKEPMHSHPGKVAYLLSGTRVRFTTPDGKSEEDESESGQALWGDPVAHSFEVLGPGEAHSVAVELKHQAVQVPAELRAAMRARDEAVWKADAPTWDRLTAASFTVVREDGRIMTKAERLAELKQQKPQPFIAPQQEQLTRFGDTVIRRFRAGDLWVHDIWVRVAGAWRVASVQLTPAAAAAAEAELDPVKLSPNMHKVLLDNEHIRVLEVRSQPGEKQPMHSHPAMVAYLMSNTRLRVTTADGQSGVYEGKVGEALWRDPVTHSIEVLGPSEDHVVIIELKHLR